MLASYAFRPFFHPHLCYSLLMIKGAKELFARGACIKSKEAEAGGLWLNQKLMSSYHLDLPSSRIISRDLLAFCLCLFGVTAYARTSSSSSSKYGDDSMFSCYFVDMFFQSTTPSCVLLVDFVFKLDAWVLPSAMRWDPLKR